MIHPREIEAALAGVNVQLDGREQAKRDRAAALMCEWADDRKAAA